MARQYKCSKVHARRATDSWLIATSLPQTKSLGKKIVAIYRLRMQIEEEFRDIKSSLFGLGFEHHKSRCVQRITILIFIATLASILANIIGLAMFMAGWHLPDLNDYGVKLTMKGMADYDTLKKLLSKPLMSTAGGSFRLGDEDYLTNEEYYDVIKSLP